MVIVISLNANSMGTVLREAQGMVGPILFTRIDVNTHSPQGYKSHGMIHKLLYKIVDGQ